MNRDQFFCAFDCDAHQHEQTQLFFGETNPEVDTVSHMYTNCFPVNDWLWNVSWSCCHSVVSLVIVDGEIPAVVPQNCSSAGHLYGPEPTGPDGAAWWVITKGNPAVIPAQ
jgi:hypothetical protein